MSVNADFIAKLHQIEELADALAAKLDESQASSRARQIVLLARTLRGRLEFGGLSVAPTDKDEQRGGAQPKSPP